MRIIKALFASIFILQVHTSFGVEISGYVKRNTSDPSPASVYVNGAKIATASDSGYFRGEVAEGNLEIYAELSLSSGVERRVPKQIYISEDTTVQPSSGGWFFTSGLIYSSCNKIVEKDK